MKPVVIKYGLTLFAFLAVGYPLFVRTTNLQWSFDHTILALNIFPLFGLTAFSLLWLHALSGVFEPWLRQYINFDRFVHYTSLIILASIILHPLLLFLSLEFRILDVFSYYDATYIWLAIIGWILIITYDIGKALRKYN